jgi:acetyl-CoA carboxylase carboxyl transferase subunit alpha
MKGLEFEKPIEELEKRINELYRFSSTEKIDLHEEIKELEQKLIELKREIFRNLTPWERMQVARHPKRPLMLDYVERIFSDFVELHGDRMFADDPAIIGGIARFDSECVFLVGHRKGKNTKENLRCNFGMPHPEGYRKALRVIKLAEKFQKPLITFVDTPGAYPGVGAEERGQGEAIASNLYTLSRLETPIIVVIIGEGGSGGAFAIGVGDRILMFENAVYSVISPEGCAAILWRDSEKVEEAAKALKITSKDLLELGFIDEIVKEPLGGAHRDYDEAAKYLEEALRRNLDEIKKIDINLLVEMRYKKFRGMGVFLEKA